MLTKQEQCICELQARVFVLEELISSLAVHNSFVLNNEEEGGLSTTGAELRWNNGSKTLYGENLDMEGSSSFRLVQYKGDLITGDVIVAERSIGLILFIGGPNVAAMPDGVSNQIFYLVVVGSFSPGTLTVTPTNAFGFSSIVFNSVGDNATLMWVSGFPSGGGWILLGSNGVTINP